MIKQGPMGELRVEKWEDVPKGYEGPVRLSYYFTEMSGYGHPRQYTTYCYRFYTKYTLEELGSYSEWWGISPKDYWGAIYQAKKYLDYIPGLHEYILSYMLGTS